MIRKVFEFIVAIGFVFSVFSSISVACSENCVFGKSVMLHAEEKLGAVAVGDFNGDGRKDVVAIAGEYSSPFFIYLQGENGEMQPPLEFYSKEHTLRGTSVNKGDLNSDGRDDIVVAMIDGFGVFQFNDIGQLDEIQFIESSTTGRIIVDDFNQDGRDDIAAIGVYDEGVINFHYQNSIGQLEPAVAYPVSYGARSDISSGDMNGDGLTDLVVMYGRNSGPGLSVLLQKNSGGFSEPIIYDADGGSLIGVAVGDVTGDGRDDLVVSLDYPTTEDKIAVYPQNISGTLDPPVKYQVDIGASPSVKIVDVNHDGLKDVVVLSNHTSHSELVVHIQSTNGLLNKPIKNGGNVNEHPGPQAIDLGDMNGDGRVDAVLAKNLWMSGIEILHGNLSDLSISFTASKDIAAVNEPVRYTATIVNNGLDIDRNVTVSYKMPLGIFIFKPLSTSQGTCDSSSNTCVLGAMAVGQSATIEFQAYSPLDSGEYTHEIMVSGASYDNHINNNSASASTTVVQGVDLRVAGHEVFSLDSTVYGDLRYKIDIQNDGPLAASNVLVSSQLSSTVNIVNAQWRDISSTRSGSCVININEVVCNIGDLSVTDLFELQVNGMVVYIDVLTDGSTSNVSNRTTVSSSELDSNVKNNQSHRLSDFAGNSINQLPAINHGGPYIAYVGASLTMDAGDTVDPEGESVKFEWILPDGSKGGERYVTYVFDSSGLSPVTVVATDGSGGVSTRTFNVNVMNTSPVIYAVSPYFMMRKNTGRFFDSSNSYDFDGSVLQYSWDFGNGVVKTGAIVAHTYTGVSGIYNAVTSVSDGELSVQKTVPVFVINTTPTVSINPISGPKKNQPISFSAYAVDANGDVLTYAWDFGDGTTSVEEKPVHTYIKSGTFTVTLVVNDGEVDSISSTYPVTIINTMPVANGAGAYEGVKGVPVTFDASASTDAEHDTLSYRWDFGDGTSGTGVSPSHTYSKGGRFKVKLVVNDGEVDSLTYTTSASIKSR